jgi:CDP-diglyceride synthetase
MPETFFQILVMLLASNGAPVLVARVCRSRGDLPVDLGRTLRDGHPVFGASKTWRGLISAVFTACMLAILFGYGSLFGLVFGILVMTGDLCSSFVKRRRGLRPGDRSIGWDQLPESLIPSAYATSALGVAWWWAILWMLTFTLVQMLLSRPLYWLRIRKKPH